MSLGPVRQCRALSVAYRKPGRHVQRNLLAQAKGEEVEEGGGGHNVKIWVISKLENNPKGVWSGEKRGSGSLDRKKTIALIEVPPSHCVFLFVCFLPVFFFSSIVA